MNTAKIKKRGKKRKGAEEFDDTEQLMEARKRFKGSQKNGGFKGPRNRNGNKKFKGIR